MQSMPDKEVYESFESIRHTLSDEGSPGGGAGLRRRSDAALLRESVDSLESEVTERWTNERERRVQLEGRNAALIKELRGLRSSIEREGRGGRAKK